METFDVQQPCKRSQGKRIKPSYFRKGVKIRVLYFILFFSDKVLLELWVHQEGSQTSDKIPCLLLGGEDMSGCVWEIWSIKWGEGRLGPALGGRAECEVCEALGGAV